MKKIKKFAAVLFFCLAAFVAASQQKYALVVGINNYYSNPGQVFSQLHGCIDDANSVKALLVSRFGFKKENVTTLFDTAATKASITLELLKILTKCNPGDAVVFYFSGHGVWIQNTVLNNGTSQNSLQQTSRMILNNGVSKPHYIITGAMVMSDLYAQNQDFLLKNSYMTNIFNMFVDKGAVLTSFFDCCYSGSILNAFRFARPGPHNNYESGETPVQKSLSIGEIRLMRRQAADSLNSATLQSRNNHYVQNAAIEDSGKNLMKAYNIRDIIYDSDAVVASSTRHHSMFLSISATDSVEKGLEVMDENQTSYHGVFTKALLSVMKRSPANIPVSQLITKIDEMIRKEIFTQTPEVSFDSQDSLRLKGNLIGIKPAAFRDTIFAQCIAVGDSIVLDAGANDGLAKGNFLTSVSNKKLQVQVVKINKVQSKAIIIKGKMEWVTAGQRFMVTDRYTTSQPIIKIFITGQSLSAERFQGFFQKNILPLVALPDYNDYQNWDVGKTSANIFLNDSSFDPKEISKDLISRQTALPFFILLPIPSYIIKTLKDSLSRNQNIQFVNSPFDADYSLYLLYTKEGGEDKNTPGFVFTYCNFHGADVNGPNFRFNKWFVKIPALPQNGKALTSLSNDLYTMTMQAVRGFSTRWFNQYPRR